MRVASNTHQYHLTAHSDVAQRSKQWICSFFKTCFKILAKYQWCSYHSKEKSFLLRFVSVSYPFHNYSRIFSRSKISQFHCQNALPEPAWAEMQINSSYCKEGIIYICVLKIAYICLQMLWGKYSRKRQRPPWSTTSPAGCPQQETGMGADRSGLKWKPYVTPQRNTNECLIFPVSGISGLSFDSNLLSPLLFFCLVLLPFLSYLFLLAGPFL